MTKRQARDHALAALYEVIVLAEHERRRRESHTEIYGDYKVHERIAADANKKLVKHRQVIDALRA